MTNKKWLKLTPEERIEFFAKPKPTPQEKIEYQRQQHQEYLRETRKAQKKWWSEQTPEAKAEWLTLKLTKADIGNIRFKMEIIGPEPV